MVQSVVKYKNASVGDIVGLKSGGFEGVITRFVPAEPSGVAAGVADATYEEAGLDALVTGSVANGSPSSIRVPVEALTLKEKAAVPLTK